TDMYNFGATFYRMVTWRHPPSAVAVAKEGLPMDAKTWQRLIKPVAELNAEAPPALCQLIQQCLAYSPDLRPERMSEVQATLDLLVEQFAQEPEDRLEALEW